MLAVGRGGGRIREEARAACHPDPGERSRQILQQEGYAGEGTVGQPVGERPAAEVVELHDHGVDARIARLDPLDGGLEQLGRLDLAAPHQVRQADGVVALVVGEAAQPASALGGAT